MLQLEALFGTVGAKTDEQVLAGYGTNMDVELTGYEILADVEHEITEGVKMQNTAFQFDQMFSMYNHVKRFGIDRSFLSLYNKDHQIDNFVGVRFPACEDMDSVGNPRSRVSQLFIVAMEDENGGFFSKIKEFVKKVWDALVNFISKIWNKIKSWFTRTDSIDKRILKDLESKYNLTGIKFTVKDADDVDLEKNIKEISEKIDQVRKDTKERAKELPKIKEIMSAPDYKALSESLDDKNRDAVNKIYRHFSVPNELKEAFGDAEFRAYIRRFSTQQGMISKLSEDTDNMLSELSRYFSDLRRIMKSDPDFEKRYKNLKHTKKILDKVKLNDMRVNVITGNYEVDEDNMTWIMKKLNLETRAVINNKAIAECIAQDLIRMRAYIHDSVMRPYAAVNDELLKDKQKNPSKYGKRADEKTRDDTYNNNLNRYDISPDQYKK